MSLLTEYLASCCVSREDTKVKSPRHLDESALTGFATVNVGDIGDFYDVGKDLGEGTYGSVTQAVKRDTNAQRAIKTIPKRKLWACASSPSNRGRARRSPSIESESLQLFQNEVSIMSMMDHPHIVRLYEIFEDPTLYHLVMEVCSGGELFDHIVRAGHFTEAEAAHCAEQIFRGVNYMHKAARIAHRDLKPENLLCLNHDPVEANFIKIIDFGHAARLTKGNKLTTCLGTASYVAPEVLKNCYDELCDMWSCGTILFVLLSGDVPFSGDTSAQILARVSRGKYSTTGSRWQHVSQDAIDLIGELLTRASSRLSAEKALEHRWISLKAPKAVGAISDCGGLICQMKQFQAANKFKKVALQIIANQMDDASSNSLRQIFEELDSNSDGLLNMTELKGGMEKAGMLDAPNIQELMSSIDVDGTGEIDYTEFLSAALSPEQYQKDDILWSAFRRIDRDGNGKISRDEMLAVLDPEGCSARVPRRARTPQNEIDLIFESVDHDCDGEIDFTEFKDMMGA